MVVLDNLLLRLFERNRLWAGHPFVKFTNVVNLSFISIEYFDGYNSFTFFLFLFLFFLYIKVTEEINRNQGVTFYPLEAAIKNQ